MVLLTVPFYECSYSMWVDIWCYFVSYELTDRYSGVYAAAGTIPLLAGSPVAYKRAEVHVSAQSMLQGSTRHDWPEQLAALNAAIGMVGCRVIRLHGS